MDPLRGEVWDAHLPAVGRHPVVVLTVNPMIPRLGAVTVAVITGTRGPAPTHVPLGPDAGLTRYDVSFANVTDVQTISKGRLQKRRGRLHPAELARLDSALRTYLGL